MMNNYEFSALLFFISTFGSILGVLSGLGGGFILIPVLTSYFNIPIHQAMGSSVVIAITNSLISPLVSSKKNVIHYKLAILLETSTLLGVICGTFILKWISTKVLIISLACILVCSLLSSYRKKNIPTIINPQMNQYSISTFDRLKISASLIVLFFAGGISSLFGIGSGFIKVLSLDLFLKLPYSVSTATSNFMVGMTATASIGFYFSQGYINHKLIFPVVLGGALGACLGNILSQILPEKLIKILFTIIMLGLSYNLFQLGLSL